MNGIQLNRIFLKVRPPPLQISNGPSLSLACKVVSRCLVPQQHIFYDYNLLPE